MVKRGYHLTRILVVLLTLTILLTGMTGQVSALKERAPVPPVPSQSHAGVVNSEWLEIVLVDQSYDNASAADTKLYTITSPDDPAFAAGIQPVAAQYRYFPEEAPYYPSFGGNIGKIKVYSRIFLRMPSAAKLKEGKTYAVSIDSKVADAGPFTFSFDLSAPNLAIHSNQVGYLAEGSKVAYLSLWTGQGSVDFSKAPAFHIVDDNTGKTVYTGAITLSTANDRWTRSDIYALDFTPFRSEGTYHIYIPTVGRSYSFHISSSIFKDNIGYTVIRGMTMQRDGNHGLDDPAVTHWNRPPAHLDDAIDQAKYIDNGGNADAARIDLVGGHMDAGDRGKYPTNSAYTSAILLTAARYFPEQIKALGETLDLPESGNGKPDFLDELVYELDWLNKAVMNTSTDGTLPGYLRPQGGNPNEGSFEQGKPPEGAADRMFYNRTQGPNISQTLFAAGALAMAYNTPIMQQYYPDKAEIYLKAAQKAYNGFKAHYKDAGYLKEDSEFDFTKDGTPHAWSDEMLFAASNLMMATGDESEYMPWINSELPIRMDNYNSIKKWDWITDSPWVNVFVALYENTKLPENIRQWAYNGILNYADSEMNHQTPFGAAAQDEGFPNLIGWRFTSAAMFPVVVGYGLTGKPEYLERIQNTWNYELGTNAVSRSFITGLGDPQRSPRWFTHELNQYQYIQYAGNNGGWPEPPPGLPNADIQSAPYPWWFDDAHNEAAKTRVYPAYENHAVMYRYTDSWNVQNEFVIADLAKNAASMLPLIPKKLYKMTVDAQNGSVLPSGGMYSEGTKLTLKAEAKPGYKFVNWKGDAKGTQNPITITMDADKTISAHFVPAPSYKLETNAVNGKIELDQPGGIYSKNTEVKLTAVPDYGYKFTGWSGDLSGAANPAAITMNSDKTVTAHFEPLSTYTLNVSAAGGSVTKNPDKKLYFEGEEVMLAAAPDLGYVFDSWSGDVSGNTPTVAVTVNKDLTIKANFRKVPVYTLKVNATEGGGVSPSGGSYNSGDQVTLNATPNEGYLFTGWSGAASGMENPLNVTMDADKTITADFAAKTSVISMDIGTRTPGNTAEDQGKYTITGSGTGLGQAPDSYRYVFESEVKGDLSITARLTAMSSGPDATAGLLIRKKLDDAASGADSQFMSIYVQNGKLYARSRAGGTSFDELPAIIDNNVSGDVWLKLTRSGTFTFNAYVSADGQTWQKFADERTLWGFDSQGACAGMFVSSGNEGKTAAASFTDVSWPAAPELP